jgi:hypothetical protein
LNVTENVEIGGNLSFDSNGGIERYDTGWLHIYNDDWTNVHLGSDNSTSDSNVTHNLNAPLSELLVKVLISTDGTDANSFEVTPIGDSGNEGLAISQVDENNITIQTGDSGFRSVNSNGLDYTLDTESWYYKIKVWKLG